jgi:ParB family transcriptional regulator, chromosome partitioning protein
MNDRKPERRGLGRGLSALMADIRVDASDTSAPSARRPDTMLAIDRLAPNPQQPRRNFAPDELESLANSIRQKGILQPLIVRPALAEGTYEIVAGERRWRAAQIAQLHEVPVLVRDFDDTEVLEVAIIENIQRSDLNPIEEAAAYRQLMDRFGHTQEKMAEALSKSRSHIANQLRLLSLPEDVQRDVREGRLTAGHARALITAGDPTALARQVIAKGLSVRETEHLARAVGGGMSRKGRGGPPQKDADTLAIERDLAAALELGVAIWHEPGTGRGKLTILYNSLDDLDFLCRALSVARRDGV